MRIIARNTITECAELQPETRASLEHWFRVAKAALWNTPREVQASFSKAKVLNPDRVRFEVAGGDYRLVIAFDFRRQVAFMKFIGTHPEYNRIDALTVNRT